MSLSNKEHIELNFKIKNKRKEIVDFKLNPAQLYYEKHRTRRNLI